MRSLFGRKMSVQDIEREVTEELETMVRTGKNPPPASWTLLGGLYGNEQAGDEPAAATAPPPAPADDTATTATGPVDEDGQEREPAPVEPVAQEVDDEPVVKAKPQRAKSGSSRTRATATRSGATRSGATRSGATRSGATRSGATRSGATRSGATRQRRSTSGANGGGSS